MLLRSANCLAVIGFFCKLAPWAGMIVQYSHRLQVFDAKGIEVDKKDTRVNGATMAVSLQKLSAGTYHVAWQAVATDTHKTSGTFDFTIQ